MGCDVTDAGQVAEAVRAAMDKFGRLDVLVNNAGQGLTASIEETDPADFRAILDLNLTAPLITMQAVLPVMRAQGGGAIVNVSSGTVFSVLPLSGAYAASKQGQATACSSTPPCSGSVQVISDDWRTRVAGRQAAFNRKKDPQIMLMQDKVVMVAGVGPGMGRSIALTCAREGADAVLFLASDLARAVTGQALDVNSGEHHH